MHYLSPVHQTLQGSPGVAGQESLAPAGEMMLPSSLLARERGGVVAHCYWGVAALPHHSWDPEGRGGALLSTRI